MATIGATYDRVPGGSPDSPPGKSLGFSPDPDFNPRDWMGPVLEKARNPSRPPKVRLDFEYSSIVRR
jgi:hypothetical protein